MLNSSYAEMVIPGILYLLYALSVITWALLVIKLVQFGRARTLNKRFHKHFWACDSLDQGESVVDRSDGPMADIARSGFDVITGRDSTFGSHDLAHQIDMGERLERALNQQIASERRSLESGLAVLASFGSTAPFIGLFGTVWGIMHALLAIGNSGSVGLEAVAEPVGDALVTTAVGIVVAVPAVVIYNFLVRRMKLGIHTLTEFSSDFYSLCERAGFQLEGHHRETGGETNLSPNATVGEKTHATA